MRKFIAVTFLFLGMLTAVSSAQDVSPTTTTKSPAITTAAQPGTHIVAAGETLSSIAQKYYGNSRQWKQIWEANKATLPDPARLAAGKKLVIPANIPAPVKEEVKGAAPSAVVPGNSPAGAEEKADKQVPVAAAAEPPAEPAVEMPESAPAPETTESLAPETATPEEAPVAEAPAVSSDGENTDQPGLLFKGECFVAPPEWQSDGYIIADKGKKLLISAGDTVYINIGSDRVRPGMQCMVYRRKGKFKDPETRDYLGMEMVRVGKIEIATDVGEKTATAKIILSYDSIEIGDEVKVIADDKGK